MCWLLTLGLIAVELVPDLLIRAETIKAEATSLGRSSRYGPGLLNIPQLVDPFVLGRAFDFRGQGNFWEGLLSIGLVPFLFLLVLLFDAEKRREHRVWILSLAGCLVFAAGPILGVYAVAYQIIPWLDSFRVPARMLFVALIPAALLAGAGFDIARGRAVRPQPLAIVWLLMALGTLAAWITGGGQRAEPWLWLIPLSVLMTLMRWSHAGFRLVKGRALASTLALLAGSLGVTELVRHTHQIIVVSPAQRWMKHDAWPGSIAADRGGGQGLPARVRADDRFYDDLQAERDGVEKINVGDSFQLDRSARLYRRLYRVFDPQADDVLPASLRPDEETLNRLAERMLDLLSVEFLIGHDPRVPLAERYPLVEPQPNAPSDLWIRRNPTALPRAYVVGRVVAPAATRNPVEDLLRLDPREGVLLHRDPLAPGTKRQEFRPTRLVASGPDHLTAEVHLDAPGILVVTSAWAKGWRAKVNGTPTEVLPANIALMAVPLSHTGRQRVELWYVPPGLALGAAISAATLAVWIALTTRLIRLGYDDCR
jgi:hypothetical protein